MTSLFGKGKIIIAVPNLESYDAKYYKEYWAAYDVPIHLYHFSKKSICSLFEKHGFSLRKIKGMKLIQIILFQISALSVHPLQKKIKLVLIE